MFPFKDDSDELPCDDGRVGAAVDSVDDEGRRSESRRLLRTHSYTFLPHTLGRFIVQR